MRSTAIDIGAATKELHPTQSACHRYEMDYMHKKESDGGSFSDIVADLMEVPEVYEFFNRVCIEILSSKGEGSSNKLDGIEYDTCTTRSIVRVDLLRTESVYVAARRLVSHVDLKRGVGRYSPFEGTWSLSAEGRKTMQMMLCGSSRDGIQIQTELREAIAGLHILFLEENGSKWRLKRCNEVDWPAVESFFSVTDMNILRCPSLIEHVLSLCRNWRRTDLLEKGGLVGRNIALFLCNFCPGIKSLLTEEIDIDPLMKCVRFLMKKDLECTDMHKRGAQKMWKEENSISLFHYRKPGFGSPSFFYRLLFDTNPYSTNEDYAMISPIYCLLREEFQNGQEFRGEGDIGDQRRL